MQNLDDIFSEYEAELTESTRRDIADGTADREAAQRRRKADAEMARMIANGAIETESDNSEEEEE